MIRRRPLSLPWDDQVPLLAALVRGGEAAVPDPRRFVDAAIHHNVLGYVVDAAADGRTALPAAERRRAADHHARRVLHAELLRRELALVDPLLAGAAGARAVVVKGPAVADRFYPDPRLRPFADLDLLVPRERLAACAAALESAGYRVLEEFRPGYAEAFGHDLHAWRAIGRHRVDVELHWRVGDDPLTTALDHAFAFEGAAPLPSPGGALAPDAPRLLVALAVHLLGDRAKRLAWVNDLRLVAAGSDDAAWARAFELASGLGLAWPLHRALDYAQRHLGFDRPRPLPAGPAPRFGPLRAAEELDVRASTHVGRLAALGWRERASYLRAVLVPTRAGLEGTVGADGAPTAVLVARHAGRMLAGVVPRRDGRR